MINFSNKKIIITGATGGIGNELVKKFITLGGNVLATGTNEKKLEDLKKNYTSLEILRFDISKHSEIENFIEQAQSKLKGLDILVNNAGITLDNLSLRMKNDEWQKVIDVNLSSTFYICKYGLKKMLKNKFGRIINISSQLVFSGGPNRTDYCAAKGGIFSFTRALSLEAVNHNILVNNIAPGVAQTALLDGIDQNVLDQAKDIIPMKRFAEPEEIAPTALLLASDEGSFYCGATLSPNGGEVMV